MKYFLNILSKHFLSVQKSPIAKVVVLWCWIIPLTTENDWKYITNVNFGWPRDLIVHVSDTSCSWITHKLFFFCKFCIKSSNRHLLNNFCTPTTVRRSSDMNINFRNFLYIYSRIQVQQKSGHFLNHRKAFNSSQNGHRTVAKCIVQ